MAAQKTMPTLKVGILIDDFRLPIANCRLPRATPASGFTFIEVLIALAVVSIALLALLRFCLLSIKIADKAQITSQAVFLAEEKISQALAAGYPKKGTDSGTADNNGVLFDWQVEVAEAHLPGLAVLSHCRSRLDKLHVEGLRKISVDVTWKQSIGRNHLQMSTYVADKTYHEP